MRRRLVVAAWALLGHSRTARQVRRGWAGLADQVQVTMLAAGKGPNVADLRGAHCQRLGGALELCLLLRVALALPGDQGAAVLEQGRGELGESGKATHGPGGDRRVGLAPLTGGELLRASVDHTRVSNATGIDRTLDKGALASHRLDQIDLGIWQGNRQHKPRKPSPRANIRDPRGLAKLLELKSREAVRDMHPPSPLRIGHRANRRPLSLQKLQDTRDRRPLRLVERAPR